MHRSRRPKFLYTFHSYIQSYNITLVLNFNIRITGRDCLFVISLITYDIRHSRIGLHIFLHVQMLQIFSSTRLATWDLDFIYLYYNTYFYFRIMYLSMLLIFYYIRAESYANITHERIPYSLGRSIPGIYCMWSFHRHTVQLHINVCHYFLCTTIIADFVVCYLQTV